MAERYYQQSSEHGVPSLFGLWELVRGLTGLLPKASLSMAAYWVSARVGGVELEAGSVDELLAELTTEELASWPDALSLTFRGDGGEVKVSAYRLSSPTISSLGLHLEGTDEARVIGAHAILTREVDRLLAKKAPAFGSRDRESAGVEVIESGPVVRALAPEVSESAPASPGPAPETPGFMPSAQPLSTYPSADVIPAPRMEPERGAQWIARTWRDHTATFLVTVLGGLLVVVLAIWLNLG